MSLINSLIDKLDEKTTVASEERKSAEDMTDALNMELKDVKSNLGVEISNKIASILENQSEMSIKEVHESTKEIERLQAIAKENSDALGDDYRTISNVVDNTKEMNEYTRSTFNRIGDSITRTIKNNAVDVTAIAAGVFSDSPIAMLAFKFIGDRVKENREKRKKAKEEQKAEEQRFAELKFQRKERAALLKKELGLSDDEIKEFERAKAERKRKESADAELQKAKEEFGVEDLEKSDPKPQKNDQLDNLMNGMDDTLSGITNSVEKSNNLVEKQMAGDDANAFSQIEKFREQKRSEEESKELLEDIRDGINDIDVEVDIDKKDGWGIGKSLLAIGAVLGAAVSGLTAGFAQSIEDFKKIGKVFTNFSQNFKNSFLGKSLTGLFDGIKSVFKSLDFKVLKNNPISNGMQSLKNFLSTNSSAGKFFEGISKITSSIGKGFNSALESVKSSFGKLSSFVGAMKEGTGVVSKLTNAVFKVFKVIGRIAAPIFILYETITGFLDGYKEDGIIGGIKGALNGIFDAVIGGLVSLFKNIATWILDAIGLDHISKALGGMVDGLMDSISQGIDGIVDVVAGIFTLDGERVLSGLGDVGGALLGVVASLGTGIINIVKGAFLDGVELVSGMVDIAGDVIKWVSEVADNILSWLGLEGIGDAITNITGGIVDTITGAVGGIKDIIVGIFTFDGEKIMSGLGDLGAGIGKFLLTPITAGLDLVYGMISDLFDFVGIELPEFNFSEKMHQIMDDIFGFITSPIDTITNWLNDENSDGLLKDLFLALTYIPRKIAEWIKKIPGVETLLNWLGDDASAKDKTVKALTNKDMSKEDKQDAVEDAGIVDFSDTALSRSEIDDKESFKKLPVVQMKEIYQMGKERNGWTKSSKDFIQDAIAEKEKETKSVGKFMSTGTDPANASIEAAAGDTTGMVMSTKKDLTEWLPSDQKHYKSILDQKKDVDNGIRTIEDNYEETPEYKEWELNREDDILSGSFTPAPRRFIDDIANMTYEPLKEEQLKLSSKERKLFTKFKKSVGKFIPNSEPTNSQRMVAERTGNLDLSMDNPLVEDKLRLEAAGIDVSDNNRFIPNSEPTNSQRMVAETNHYQENQSSTSAPSIVSAPTTNQTVNNQNITEVKSRMGSRPTDNTLVRSNDRNAAHGL